MKIELEANFSIDVLAVQSAVNAINLPCSFGVTQIGDTVSIESSTDCSLTKEQEEAIRSIAALQIGLPSWNPIRMQRAPLLAEVDWRMNRAMDNGEDITPLIAYRRALRDITKQESPSRVVWPSKPWRGKDV